MTSRLRRWIALLALLLVPVTGTAASPLCMAGKMGESGATAPAAHHGDGEHGHHARGNHRGEPGRRGDDGRRGERPAGPACPLGMTAGAGGCLGGFLSVAAPRVDGDAADPHSFLPPLEPRPRLDAVSLFRPPRA